MQVRKARKAAQATQGCARLRKARKLRKVRKQDRSAEFFSIKYSNRAKKDLFSEFCSKKSGSKT